MIWCWGSACIDLKSDQDYQTYMLRLQATGQAQPDVEGSECTDPVDSGRECPALQEFEVVRELGRGAHATCFLAVYKPHQQQLESESEVEGGSGARLVAIKARAHKPPHSITPRLRPPPFSRSLFPSNYHNRTRDDVPGIKRKAPCIDAREPTSRERGVLTCSRCRHALSPHGLCSLEQSAALVCLVRKQLFDSNKKGALHLMGPPI